MIQKPYNLSVRDKVIDASEPYSLSWLTSGDTSESFSIEIYNNTTNVLAYSLSRTYSFAMSYTIPANSFPNGVDYKIAITVWNNADQSATSQFVVFTASSKPVVTVPAIGTVGNHAYLFTATYSQSESDPLAYYTVNLFDSNQSLLKTSGVKTDISLEHRFDLMKNDTTYYVEFVVTSKKGLTATSGLIQFTVVYENPSMYFELSAETLPETASVKLNWSVKQVIGRTDIEPIYLNNTELDIRTGKLTFDEGFEVTSDFTLKIWFRNLVLDTELIYFKGSNGELRLWYSNTDLGFYVYKKVNTFAYNYFYPIDADSNKTYLCIQQRSGRLDMYSENYI